jgi:hypothetical protein
MRVLTAVSNIVAAFSLNSSERSASAETNALTSADRSISVSSDSSDSAITSSPSTSTSSSLTDDGFRSFGKEPSFSSLLT